jgi:signal transduction histidine kinase
VSGDAYGGLVLFYDRERSFSQEDTELVYAFADQAALAIANEQLRDRSEEMAAASERNRLARELHDAVTQTLFSASLLAETLPEVWESDPDEGVDLLTEMRRLSRGALAEMRTLLLELRPTALIEANLGDLLRQLAVAATGRTGVPVSASVNGRCDLPSDVHIALYRIAQESLNNVVKHSAATQVEMKLHCSEVRVGPEEDLRQRVELRVSDDGRGFDPAAIPSGRLGLSIIRERAEAIGAKLELETALGKGTKVLVVWPSGTV